MKFSTGILGGALGAYPNGTIRKRVAHLECVLKLKKTTANWYLSEISEHSARVAFFLEAQGQYKALASALFV